MYPVQYIKKSFHSATPFCYHHFFKKKSPSFLLSKTRLSLSPFPALKWPLLFHFWEYTVRVHQWALVLFACFCFALPRQPSTNHSHFSLFSKLLSPSLLSRSGHYHFWHLPSYLAGCGAFFSTFPSEKEILPKEEEVLKVKHLIINTLH